MKLGQKQSLEKLQLKLWPPCGRVPAARGSGGGEGGASRDGTDDVEDVEEEDLQEAAPKRM